jgi:hypothetical protein
MTDPTPPRRRRAVLVGVSGALVAGLVVTLVLVLLNRGGSDSPATKVVGAPVAKPTPARTPSATASATPAAKPKPAVSHDFVAAAAPTSFSYAAPRYTIKATVCGMAYVRPLDPPGEQHHTVCWVQHDFGFAPGSKGRGTTYVLGHSWAEDRLEVLNNVSEAAMREVLPEIAHHRFHLISNVATYRVTHLDGDVITLHTPKGTLRYTVRGAFAVAKEDAGYVRPLMAQRTRNRVVIITCGELHGVDYDYNIIVNAFLTSSQATNART